MERHQGSWKVEGEEEYNIGELVIDNDYIEFFVRGKSIPWGKWNFISNHILLINLKELLFK